MVALTLNLLCFVVLFRFIFLFFFSGLLFSSSSFFFFFFFFFFLFVLFGSLFFFFFFFFSFLAALWHMKVSGQGSDPSHNCNLCHSCNSTESLTHCAGAGIEPAFWCCRDTTDPIVPQWELLDSHLWIGLFSSGIF